MGEFEQNRRDLVVPGHPNQLDSNHTYDIFHDALNFDRKIDPLERTSKDKHIRGGLKFEFYGVQNKIII